MSDEPREPDLELVLDMFKDSILRRVRGFDVGVVTRYSEDSQSVSVRPVVARARSLETGVKTVKISQEIHNVPVWFFRCGGVGVTAPVVVGDYGLILYSSVSLELWKRLGGVGVDPRDDRRHDEGDAFFIPGAHPLTAPQTSAPTDALVLHAGDKVVRIGGPSGTQKTLMGDNFLNALDTVLDAVHTAVGALPGGAAAAATLLVVINAFQASVFRDTYKTAKTEVK